MPPDSKTIHLPWDPPLSVVVKRTSRARRVSLRVSRLDGAVTLTVPARTSDRVALGFLRDRQAWLRDALQGIDGPQPVHPGAILPVEGRLLTVTPAAVRAARIDADRLLVPQSRPQAAALAFLKLHARNRLAERIAVHAAAVRRVPGKLTLRDTRSRWGSCNAAGDLMFNWRLVMAPPRILDYVAAHEVAHLVHMNHAPEFWAVVARIFPAHDEARRWLKSEGTALHRYRFAAA